MISPREQAPACARVHNAPVRVRDPGCEEETAIIKSREGSYYRVTRVYVCIRDVRRVRALRTCVRVLGVLSISILYVYSLEEFFFFLFL